MSAATEHEVEAMHKVERALGKYFNVCIQNSGTSDHCGIHAVAQCQGAFDKGEIAWEFVDYLADEGFEVDQAMRLAVGLTDTLIQLCDKMVHLTKETP